MLSPYLNRFLQPDSIIPSPSNPQSWNRYSYVTNRPVNFNDPTGHWENETNDPIEEQLDKANEHVRERRKHNSFDNQYGISFEGNWNGQEGIVRTAVQNVANALLRDYRLACGWSSDCETYSAAKLFKTVYGGVTFARVTNYTDPTGVVRYSGAITKSPHRIEFASLPQSYSEGVKTPAMAYREAVNNVVHELGHAFAQKWYPADPRLPYDPAGPYVNIPGNLVSNEGFYLYPGPEGAQYTWRQHPCTSGYDCPAEVFADMFLGWTYGAWASDSAGVGNDRRNFMNQNMGPWTVDLASP